LRQRRSAGRVTDLVQRLGASANMVFRLLQTLEQDRWITRVTDGPQDFDGAGVFGITGTMLSLK